MYGNNILAKAIDSPCRFTKGRKTTTGGNVDKGVIGKSLKKRKTIVRKASGGSKCVITKVKRVKVSVKTKDLPKPKSGAVVEIAC